MRKGREGEKKRYNVIILKFQLVGGTSRNMKLPFPEILVLFMFIYICVCVCLACVIQYAQISDSPRSNFEMDFHSFQPLLLSLYSLSPSFSPATPSSPIGRSFSFSPNMSIYVYFSTVFYPLSLPLTLRYNNIDTDRELKGFSAI